MSAATSIGLPYPTAGDGVCALHDILAEAASRLDAALTAAETVADAIRNRPLFRVSATGTTCDADTNNVVFNGVDFDPSGLADLTADPNAVELGNVPGMWLKVGSVVAPYSGTSGNVLYVDIDGSAKSVRDLDASQNPPSGGVATTVAFVEYVEYPNGGDSKASMQLFWNGVGAPSVPVVTSATIAAVRIGDV